MAAQKRKTRMYEPWGYQDENNYKSTEIMVENDFDAFLVDTSYNKDDNKIYFTNKDGETKASLDVSEFVKSDSIIEKTEYKDGILKIYFTNGDIITIDLTELLDENEFKDGLIVADHIVKVLIDGESDSKYVSVSENGVKVAGIEADIEAEEARATSAETALDTKIDAEIARATSAETALDTKIDAETTRAEEAEAALDEKIDQEITDRTADVDAEETRATNAENAISSRVNALNDELDAEESRAQSAEQELSTRLTTEIAERKADVDEEEARAKAAEAALQNAIDAEETRAEEAEATLQAAIEAEGQRAQDAETALDAKIDAVESALTDAIADEQARAEAAEEGLENAKFDNVVYDSTAKTITFYANSNLVGTIDTTDFVKDGMIDDVKIENDKLVIVFNTDSGKETIYIPLSEIFNPDNYYDKTDVDNIVSGINSSIAAEATTARAAELGLQGAIDAEEARAISAETNLNTAIASEATTARAAEQANADAISAEETARIAADEAQDAVIALKADASAVTVAIAAEETRAIGAENDILDTIEELNGIKFDNVAYDSSAKTINFIADGSVVKGLDATPFIKDGMIDDVKIEGGNLVIIFNTDSGKEKIEIPLTDIFNPSNYYTKGEVDGKVTALQAGIDANAAAIAAEEARSISADTDLQTAIDLKADKETTYTKEDVDALIAEKEAEIVQIKKDYNSLKEIVGELGGNVEWGVPADGTFNNMMKKSGIVKLGEDTTTSTYTGGITSKNKTTLHLNGKNLTFSGTTTNNPGIMTRGKQELTIMGKGTFDAAGRIAVEANGADTVINLSGTTGMFGSEPTYVTDRSGGELIYCYLGTINISAGVFKNNGDDKTFLLNCYDANYRAGTAKIIVTGGKFYDFNPADNSAEGEHTSFVPEGYHVDVSQEGDSTVYTVKKD